MIFFISSLWTIGMLFCCCESSSARYDSVIPNAPKQDTTPSSSSCVIPVESTTPIVSTDIQAWITMGDQSKLLHKQNLSYTFVDTAFSGLPTIAVDATQTYQTVDGFGFTLSSGSVGHINTLSAEKKNALLTELFSRQGDGIGMDYVRISVAASDLNATVFSYDDEGADSTDGTLPHFNLGIDSSTLVPLLQEIVSINPSLKILASPWSAPKWMKTNYSFIGGSLQKRYYTAYAHYLAKYIQTMDRYGIKIDALTIQNEPLHGGNNPSMVMTDIEQADFVKNYLGPKFRDEHIATKIIIYDHNCDKPSYPINVLNDTAAKRYIDGSAFHLYAGDISALSTVHNAHPDKNVYFTEQWFSSTGAFKGDLIWHLQNVVIGSMNNWGKTALEWNLTNNATYTPYTPNGGCNSCKGGLTINNGTVERNTGYYTIGHASKFVPTGSKRIYSSHTIAGISASAFITPTGKNVLLVVNSNKTPICYAIKSNSKWAKASIPSESVITYVW